MSQLNFRLPSPAVFAASVPITATPGVPLASGLDVSVEVRKANLTVLARTTVSQSVDIAQPGLYLVSACLPEGTELSGSVTITQEVIESGQAVTLELAPDPDALPPENTPAPSSRKPFEPEPEGDDGGGYSDGGYIIYDPEGGSTSRRNFLEGLQTQYEMPPENGIWMGGGRKAASHLEGLGADAPESPVLLRAFSGGKWNQYEALPEGWGTIAPLAQGQAQVRRLNSNVRLVQLLQANKRPINVAIPSGESDQCWLEISREANGEAALIVHLENTAADALLRYRANGFVRQAEAQSQAEALNAEALLFGKQRAPISAAVGAYALLRFGDMARLHDEWTQNLHNWFAWLPDGSAIRGEHLARLGQHEEALNCFLELETRGLPFFSPGLSYTIDRLRLYTSVKNANFDVDKLVRASKLMAMLCAYSGCVAFDKILLTFIGLDPNKPDDAKLSDSPYSFDGIDAAAYLSDSPLVPSS